MKKLTFKESLHLFDNSLAIEYKEWIDDQKGKEKKVGILVHLFLILILFFLGLTTPLLNTLTPSSDSIFSGTYERIVFVSFLFYYISFGIWFILVYGIGMNISENYLNFYRIQFNILVSAFWMTILMNLTLANLISGVVPSFVCYLVLFFNTSFFMFAYIFKAKNMLKQEKKRRERKKRKFKFLLKI